MPEQTINEMGGLDVRRLREFADPRTLRIADNVTVTRGKGLETRPGSERISQVDPDSKGLYSIGGSLRAAAPAGYSDLFNAVPVRMKYDFIGDGAQRYDRGSIKRVINVEAVSTNANRGVFPYLTIEREDGTKELHWLDVEPDDQTDFPKTRVDTPFIVTGGAISLESKVWVPAGFNGAVKFSSTEFGPRDYTTIGDAGFLPVIQSIVGDRTITGLSYFQNRLLVAFEDAIQLWAVDPDPNNHFLVDTLNGPGTEHSGTMVNVLGDAYYFSRGGFRSLSQSSTTGQVRDGDIGSAIYELTKDLDATNAKSVWSQSFGTYLTILDGSIYAFVVHPISKAFGWSKWSFPVDVVDFTEHEGTLYYRGSDDGIYRLNPDLDNDEGTPIPFKVQFNALTGGGPNRTKWFEFMTAVQEGTSRVSYVDSQGRTRTGPLIRDSSKYLRRAPIGVASENLSIQFEGTGRWRLDSYTVHYRTAGK